MTFGKLTHFVMAIFAERGGLSGEALSTLMGGRGNQGLVREGAIASGILACFTLLTLLQMLSCQGQEGGCQSLRCTPHSLHLLEQGTGPGTRSMTASYPWNAPEQHLSVDRVWIFEQTSLYNTRILDCSLPRRWEQTGQNKEGCSCPESAFACVRHRKAQTHRRHGCQGCPPPRADRHRCGLQQRRGGWGCGCPPLHMPGH